MTTAVEKKQETAVLTLREALSKQSKAIKAALPKHVDVNRFLRIALNAYSKNPDLLVCSMNSIVEGIMQSAQLGLTLDGALGQAYLVRYNNTAQFQIGYQGLIDLATRAKPDAIFSGRCVYKGDTFEYEYGSEGFLKHKRPLGGTERDEDILAAYARVEYRDGREDFEVVSRARLDKSMDASPSGAKGPWGSWFPEMATKTAYRILLKRLRLCPDTQLAVGLEEQAEAGVPQTFNVDALVVDQASDSSRVATDARQEALKKKISKNGKKASKEEVKTIEILIENEGLGEGDVKELLSVFRVGSLEELPAGKVEDFKSAVMG